MKINKNNNNFIEFDILNYNLFIGNVRTFTQITQKKKMAHDFIFHKCLIT